MRVPIKALSEALTVNKVKEALSRHFGAPVRLAVELGTIGGSTAASQMRQQQDERAARAQESIEADPFVRALVTEFDGRVLPESIRSNE